MEIKRSELFLSLSFSLIFFFFYENYTQDRYKCLLHILDPVWVMKLDLGFNSTPMTGFHGASTGSYLIYWQLQVQSSVTSISHCLYINYYTDRSIVRGVCEEWKFLRQDSLRKKSKFLPIPKMRRFLIHINTIDCGDHWYVILDICIKKYHNISEKGIGQACRNLVQHLFAFWPQWRHYWSEGKKKRDLGERWDLHKSFKINVQRLSYERCWIRCAQRTQY